MSNINALNNVGAGTLTLWTELNSGGSGSQKHDGDAGILAANTDGWYYKSVGISDMQLFVWSAPDVATPGYSFAGHTERVLNESFDDLPSAFSGVAYPLQYLTIDPASVAAVMVKVASSATPMALSPSQTYPGGSTPLVTFAAQDITGALGFVSVQSGSQSAVAIQYGDYSTTTNSVNWSGSGSLTLSWNGSAPVISGLTGLPAGWSFGSPAKQSDGSWLVTLDIGAAVDTGRLYSGANYTGSAITLNPHVLTQLNPGLGWVYSSLKLTQMPALIYSAFSPSNKSYVYTAYQEQLLTDNVANFASVFSGATPVNLLSLDNTDVVVNLTLNTTSSSDSVMVMTQAYPQPFYTFASVNRYGLLAVLPASGAEQSIAVQYGSLDASGHFTSTGTGTLIVSLSNGIPVVTVGSDLPENWNLSMAEQQPDGSWRVVLSDQVVQSSLALYPQINYGGAPVNVAEHNSVTLRTLANFWQYDSVRVSGLRWLSNTLFTLDQTGYDFRKYRDSYSASDVADISSDYPLASPLINGMALGSDDVVVLVNLAPVGASTKMVLRAQQSWPAQICTASVIMGKAPRDGVLVVFDKTQALRTIDLSMGIMNSDGSATWIADTTLTAAWDHSLQKPILSLGSDAPADWNLLNIQPTAQAGEFMVDLAFTPRNVVTLYPITDAPAISQLNSDETYVSYNKVALYSQQDATVTVTLSGSARFRNGNQSSCTIALTAMTMTTVEFSDKNMEPVAVTVSGEGIDTQQVTVSFGSFPYTNKLRMVTNSGAPAATGGINSVYFDSTDLHFDTLKVQLSGSAVFAGSQQNSATYPLKMPYDYTFDIVNTVAETVTITATAIINSDSSHVITATSSFVESDL